MFNNNDFTKLRIVNCLDADGKNVMLDFSFPMYGDFDLPKNLRSVTFFEYCSDESPLSRRAFSIFMGEPCKYSELSDKQKNTLLWRFEYLDIDDNTLYVFDHDKYIGVGTKNDLYVNNLDEFTEALSIISESYIQIQDYLDDVICLKRKRDIKGIN